MEWDRQQMTIWHMCIACWTTMATRTHSEYVTLIVFLLHQWLQERSKMLRYMYSTLPFLLLVTSNTNKAALDNNDSHSLFALCFNNSLFPYKYSHSTHSIQPLTPVPSRPALPYMLYCAVHSVTPVCCTKHCALCAVPLLQHSLYGDHMLCLHRWIISSKLHFPYKQVLPAVCLIRHCLDRSV
jgi:hypothetical protein